MENLRKSGVKYFRQIVIEEYDDHFKVIFYGNTNSNSSMKLKKGYDDDKLLEIVQMYLNTYKINGINRSIPLIRRLPEGYDNYAEVFGDNNKRLKMRIYSPKYKVISTMAMDKYSSDRFNSLCSEEYDELILGADSDKTFYEKNDNVLNLVLKTDWNGNVLLTEREFFRNFLYEKFFSIGKKATIMRCPEKINNQCVTKCVIQCGDMTISYFHRYSFSFIPSIIDEYNEEFKHMKRR